MNNSHTGILNIGDLFDDIIEHEPEVAQESQQNPPGTLASSPEVPAESNEAPPMLPFRIRPVTREVPPVDQLTNMALADLCADLQRYGNELNDAHTAALRDILHTYSRFAYADGLNPKVRYAFPLATAMGKTRSIISWAVAVHQLNLPFTLLVCQEQIRDLNELRNDLIARGIPETSVGLFHRDPKQAPISEGAPSDYPFVLVTHCMLRTSKDAEQYMNMSDDTSRSVCVHDESLLKSEGRTVSGSNLEAAKDRVNTVLNGRFARRDEITPAQVELLTYLEDALDVVVGRFRKDDSAPFELNEQLSAATLARYELALKTLPHPMDKASRAVIGSFLSMVSEPLRVARLGQGNKDGVISYELRIPATLQNVVILDASAAIRELQEADKDIHVVSEWEHVKRFNNVRIEQYLVQSGAVFQRDKMTASSALLRDVSSDVQGDWLPENEAVVFCTSKSAANLPRSRKSPVEKLKARLTSDGIDLDAQVLVWEGPDQARGLPAREVFKPKYEFLTFGRERSTNNFRHCSRIISIGVSRRDLVDLAGNLAGQLEDLSSPDVLNRDRVMRIQASEQFHSLLQLIGRGTTRRTINGEAGSAFVKIYDHGDFSPFIQRGLPGCTWNIHKSAKHAKNVGHKRRQMQKSTDRQKAEAAGIIYLNAHAGKVMVSDVTALPSMQKLGQTTRKKTLASIAAVTGRARSGHARGSNFAPTYQDA
jgi:hypothetical protein